MRPAIKKLAIAAGGVRSIPASPQRQSLNLYIPASEDGSVKMLNNPGDAVSEGFELPLQGWTTFNRLSGSDPTLDRHFTSVNAITISYYEEY